MDLISMVTVENRHRGHWFSPKARRFFNSRIAAYGYQHHEGAPVYFVSSERFDASSPRRYTVRRYNWDADTIDTMGDFQRYASRSGADAAAQRLARQSPA